MFRKSLQFVNATFEQNLVKQRGYKIKKNYQGLQDLYQCDLRGRKIWSYFRNEERLGGACMQELLISFIQNKMCTNNTGHPKIIEQIWTLLVATVGGS